MHFLITPSNLDHEIIILLVAFFEKIFLQNDLPYPVFFTSLQFSKVDQFLIKHENIFLVNCNFV